MPLLPEMERTVALISHAFAGSDGRFRIARCPLPSSQEHQPLFAADAFSNPDHLKFAIRGALATMLAYTVYTAIAWPGLSTSGGDLHHYRAVDHRLVASEAVSTTRWRHYRRLRLRHGSAGLRAAASGLHHRLHRAVRRSNRDFRAGSRLPRRRLSYLGVQMALAFYLINLQEFAPQYSLSIARDRVVGVLLGSAVHVAGVRPALDEGRLAGDAGRVCPQSALAGRAHRTMPRSRIWRSGQSVSIQLRDQINEGFNAVKAQADAVVFEFGPSRQRKLKIRDDVRRWQPTLGTLHAGGDHLSAISVSRCSCTNTAAADQGSADGLRRKSGSHCFGQCPTRFAGRVSSAHSRHSGIRRTAERSDSDAVRAIRRPIPPPLTDMIALTQNLASIVAPLSRGHSRDVRRSQRRQRGTRDWAEREPGAGPGVTMGLLRSRGEPVRRSRR